jgi:hypothetical protein
MHKEKLHKQISTIYTSKLLDVPNNVKTTLEYKWWRFAKYLEFFLMTFFL